MRSSETSDPANEFRHGDYEARSRATKEHILNAAVEVLIEFGYSGASTLRIQSRAGVSRGRLLHHYPHRDALLVAAVQFIAEARVSSARTVEWPIELGARSDAAVEAMWATYHEGYFWAATELWLAARHNQSLAFALAPRERSLGAAIRAVQDEMFGAQLNTRPEFPDLREVLNTSMRGVALTYSFEPRNPPVDFHLGLWKTLARRELHIVS